MEAEKRKSVRLMSSLVDLKIIGATKTTENSCLESKLPQGRPRNNKKIMAIKGLAEDTTIYETFERVNKVLADADERLIRNCLASHFVFSSIIKDSGIMQYLLKSFFHC